MDYVEQKLFFSSSRHPWELARYKFFSQILKTEKLLSPDIEILDIGAGDGWFSSMLSDTAPFKTPIVCWDTAYDDAIGRAPPSGRQPQRISERPKEKFDVLLFLDVLEHIETDADFLRLLIEKNLQRDGHALISVPCWPWLFSGHDRRLHHVRRYTPAGCRRLIESSGMKILQSGGLFHSLLVARMMMVLWQERFLRRKQPHAHIGDAQISTPLRLFSNAALQADISFSQWAARMGWTLPGLSWWALCQKQ